MRVLGIELRSSDLGDKGLNPLSHLTDCMHVSICVCTYCIYLFVCVYFETRSLTVLELTKQVRSAG